MPARCRGPDCAELPPDRVITLENDTLAVTLAIGPEVQVTSLRYKPRDVEFIQPDHPMPLVGIENTWSLNNVGVGLREVEMDRAAQPSQVRIHACSNYLENPFHLFAELRLGGGATLDMTGNVAEMTDSFQDDGWHWFSYLRGGSWFQATGSLWYTENGLMTNHQRLTFWWLNPAFNRSPAVGFRCAKPAHD